MVAWVVKNGEWFLSEGPSWAVSTWVTDERQATTYRSQSEAIDVVREARKYGYRPFGQSPDTAMAVRKTT